MNAVISDLAEGRAQTLDLLLGRRCLNHHEVLINLFSNFPLLIQSDYKNTDHKTLIRHTLD